MNYYQSVDYEPVAPIRRRRYSDMEDDDLYTTAGIFPAARKALSISNKAMDDGDIRTSVSTRKDQQLLSDITAKLADIAQPVVVRAPSRRVAVRQTAPRIVVGRGSTIYPYTSLPDEVVYSRRSMRAASVPPSPVLSAAEIEYVPGFSRRMEMYTRAESEPPEQIRQKVGYYYGRQPASVEYPGDVAVMSYAPSYYSSGRSAYAVPASPASRRVRYSYSETSPDVSPAYTLNNLRVRTSDARNKLDAHRTMLDRYLPDTGIEEDVQSAVLYKYGELVDRMPSLEPYRPRSSANSGAASPTITSRRDFSKYNNGGQIFRPQVSDTRKRLREVLCRTKGDPKYYAY